MTSVRIYGALRPIAGISESGARNLVQATGYWRRTMACYNDTYMGPMPYPTTNRVRVRVETTADTPKYAARASMLGVTIELPM